MTPTKCGIEFTNCEQPAVRRYEIRFCNQWEIVTRCDRHRVPEGSYRDSWSMLEDVEQEPCLCDTDFTCLADHDG